ncbi:MAG: amidohydrolase [Bacteroidota bacterium]
MDTILNIALVQSPLIWEDPERNRHFFSERIDTIQKEVDLIVLPEMFHTGFTMDPQHIEHIEGAKTLDWMLDISQTKKAALVGSIPFYEHGHHTNRLFFVKPNGNYSWYDKRHTFTLAGEDKVYQAGKEKLIVNYKGFKICPLICYDLRFPVWARNSGDYEVLLYVANWPRPRITAWDTLLKARAIENMSYCIGVNRVGTDGVGHEYPGHSSVYDALGEQLVFSKEETILYTILSQVHIQSSRSKLKFLEDRDNFNLIV